MKRVRAFALPAAIFLLVILAMLGAFMASFSTTQQVDSASDIQGSRGYHAARMGAEWITAKICNGGAPCASALTACPAASTVMSATPDGFTVTVTCTMSSYSEGSSTRYVYWITSTATTGGSPGSLSYVERNFRAFIDFSS